MPERPAGTFGRNVHILSTETAQRKYGLASHVKKELTHARQDPVEVVVACHVSDSKRRPSGISRALGPEDQVLAFAIAVLDLSPERIGRWYLSAGFAFAGFAFAGCMCRSRL